MPALWFPPTAWWVQALEAGHVVPWAPAQLPRKTLFSRAQINTANGLLGLSLPVVRNRSAQPAGAVRLVGGADNWRQLERTLHTAYGRSPFFEHYMPHLRPHLEGEPLLLDLNVRLIRVVIDRLRLPIRLEPLWVGPPPEGIAACPAGLFTHYAPPGIVPPTYYPTFEPFTPNLSILDGLFCAGPELFR